MRPEREPITRESRDEMDMRMKHDLSGSLAIVHHEIDPVGLECLLEGDCDDAHCFCYMRPILCGDVEYIVGMLSGNYERMAFCYRMYIEEAQRFIGLIDFVRGNVTANYFTKDAFVHMKIIAY